MKQPSKQTKHNGFVDSCLVNITEQALGGCNVTFIKNSGYQTVSIITILSVSSLPYTHKMIN